MLLSEVVRYGKRTMRVLRWLPSLLLLVPWLVGPPAPSTEDRLRELSGAVSFRLLDWETVQLGGRADRLWRGLVGSTDPRPSDAQALKAYFASDVPRVQARSDAEAALERAVGK